MSRILSETFEMLPGFSAPTTVHDVLVDGKTVATFEDANAAWKHAAEVDPSRDDEEACPRAHVQSRAVVGDWLAFFIRPEKFDEMKARFEKLAKRAAKNGKPAPSWEQVGTRTREIEKRDFIGYNRSYTETCAIITVEVADVTLQGWRFVATLERMGEENLVRTSPKAQADGITVPVEFRSRYFCDHCRTKRARNATYLFQHEDGQWMQTGTNCAADIFGSDSGAEVAYWASYADTIRGGGDMDEDGFGGGRRAREEIGIFEFLLAVAIHIKAYGWVSRGAAKARDRDGECSTASLAWAALTAPPGSKSAREARADLLKALDKRGVTSVELAEKLSDEINATIAWTATLKDNSAGSDYLYNLRVACGVGYATGKTSGIVASAYPAWLKEQDREVARKQRDATSKSEWIAPVGTKFGLRAKGSLPAIEVEVVYTRDFYSDFGVKTLVTMRDLEGRTAKWWASGGIEVQKGTRYMLSGTVKSCDTYKDRKETTFTRCTLNAATAEKV